MAHPARNGNKVVNMEELVSSMKKELNYYWSLDEMLDNTTNSCMIYKVQQHIREVDRFAYEPFVVSIGPYHHGSLAVQAMEKEKWFYLDYILKLNCEKTLLDYLTAIEVEGLAKQARHCYAENIKMTDEDFLQMLLLDGSFILVSVGATKETERQWWKVYNERSNVATQDTDKMDGTTDTAPDQEGDQSNNSGQWFIRFFNHDILLLENQIPFFIIKKIYELVSGKESEGSAFTDDIADYIESSLRCYPKAICPSDRPKSFHHLVHLCHMYFRPSHRVEDGHHHQVGRQLFNKFIGFGRRYFKLIHDPDADEQRTQSDHDLDRLQAETQLLRWRRAAQYLEAGVKFKKREYSELEPHSLLDIKFSQSIMEIPCLIIDELTAFLFRNLVAFEQTCPQFGDDFTAYIVFLSQLISMPEDVTLLAQREIVVHHLESDEKVSDLFTMLSKDVVFDFNGSYYLKHLCQTMEACYQSRLNRWMAWLWSNHFSNPWLGLAALATVIVLLCTIVQTVFGVLAYTSPPK